MANQVDCLMSSVRNISGGSLFFHFLPPHGKTLASYGEYTCPGNVLSYVTLGLQGAKAALLLERAISEGLLEIKYTPSPVFWDKGRQRISLMQCYNDKLVVMSPCWGSAGPEPGLD